MTPHDISESLTAAEARCAVLAFLTAIERNDVAPSAQQFVHDLQRAVSLTEGLSLGTIAAIDDGRCRLTVTDLDAIRESNASSYQLALQLNVPASTVRAARKRAAA